MSGEGGISHYSGNPRGDLSKKMQHVKTRLSPIVYRLSQQVNTETSAGYLQEYVRHLSVETLKLILQHSYKVWKEALK